MAEYQDIEERTFNFTVRVIKMVNCLPPCTASFELGKQVLRSGCSVNSNIVHAQSASSKKGFIYYMNITKTESKETKRWFELIVAAKLHSLKRMKVLIDENEEIIKILVSSVKTAEANKKISIQNS